MTSILLTGPRHTLLEERAFQRADAIADESLGSVLYITRNDARRSEVEDRWRESNRPLRLRAETLETVVREWYEATHGPVKTLSGQLDRRLAEYALDRSALGNESASPALADALSNRFSLFDDAGVATANELAVAFEDSVLDDQLTKDTVDAYRQYLDLQATHLEDWMPTRGEMYRSVSETNTPLLELSPEVNVVILSGYHEFRPIERWVIERVVSSFPTIAVLPLHRDGNEGVDVAASDALDLYDTLGFERQSIEPEREPGITLGAITNALYRANPESIQLPNGLRWRELPSLEREIRFVARELRAELATGRDPDELAVVIPGIGDYTPLVDDVFETFEIPFVTTAATPLEQTLTGRVVHSLLDLAGSNPHSEDLTTLFANPLVELLDEEQVAKLTTATRRRETVSVQPVLADLDQALAALVENLLATLEPLQTDSLQEAVSTLRELLEGRFDLESAAEEYADGAERALEEQAVSLVDEILTSFETMAGSHSDHTPLTMLNRAFDGVPLRTQQRVATGHVEVMGMLDARMRSFDRVFLVGLTEEHFPDSPNRPQFFEQMTDADPRFDTADELFRSRYLFATLLSNANSVTITTPATGSGNSAVVRSPILDELQRVTEIEPVEGVDDRVGSREDLQRHIASGPNRREAVNAAGDRGDLSSAQTKRTDRGLYCADNRSTATLTAHDGLLEPDTVAAVYPPEEREPYSASRIERYVECGFKFYGENILDIEDIDGVEEAPTPLETGKFVHDVLERFYAELRDGTTGIIDLSQYDRADLEAHLHEVALDELKQTDFDYNGLYHERWKAELFAGLGDEVDAAYEAGEVPHGSPARGLLASFLNAELTRDGGWTPHLLEAPFGEGLPDSTGGPFEIARPDGTTVSVRGYIDRVDVNRDDTPPELTLYDYKTGNSPAMNRSTGGTKFQLPIYLLAVEGVLEDGLLEGETLSATYYQVKPPNDIHVPRGIESKFDSEADLRHFLEGIVPGWIGQIDQAIANGRFHTTLLDPREANCSYCDFRRACDVRHHRKRERVGQAQSDYHAYVPLYVRDDATLEAVMNND